MSAMTPMEWKALPPLIRRRHLFRVGLTKKLLEAALVIVADGTAPVPPRRIIAVRMAGIGNLLYHKSTVTPFLPWEFQETNNTK